MPSAFRELMPSIWGSVQPDDELQVEGFRQRLEGMQAVLAEFPDATLETLLLHLSASSARSLVETRLVGAHHPTGIYAFSDEYEVILLGALTRHGIRIPQDIALLGTDNLPLGEYVWPSLTTMDFNVVDLGKHVVELISSLQQERVLPEEFTRPLIHGTIRTYTGRAGSEHERPSGLRSE